MRRPRRLSVLLTTVLLLAGVNGLAHAAATKKIVLQLTDNTVEKQALVLNVAQNLLNAYGDKVQIEVVAFGPGLSLVFSDNPNAERVTGLARQGIRFSACSNTVRKMTELMGSKPGLAPLVVEVGGGAERIIELIENGYILLHP